MKEWNEGRKEDRTVPGAGIVAISARRNLLCMTTWLSSALSSMYGSEAFIDKSESVFAVAFDPSTMPPTCTTRPSVVDDDDDDDDDDLPALPVPPCDNADGCDGGRPCMYAR